jgi:hypothetical protein
MFAVLGNIGDLVAGSFAYREEAPHFAKGPAQGAPR